MTPPEAKPDSPSGPETNGARPPGPEPAFLARARRILSGDIHPDDYLPVTTEVRRAVERAMADYRERGKGREVAPEVEPRQLLEELLCFHHGGQVIVFTETDRGVIVLAVGGEQIKPLMAEFGPTHAERLIFDTPLAWK